MREKDRNIVLDLKKRLPEVLLNHVKKMIIYGSRARGEGTDDSDIDLLVLVDDKTPDIEKALDDIAYSVMWDYDFKPIISLKVFAEPRFRIAVEKGLSFYRHVEKEGISI